MATKTTTPKRILMLNEPSAVKQDLQGNLEKEGFSLTVVSSVSDARQDLIENGLPDGMLISLEGSEQEGLAFCNEMMLYAGLPVIVLGTDSSNEQTALQALTCADSYLRPKEASALEVTARLERIFSRISSFAYALGPKIQLTRDIVLHLIEGIISIGASSISLTPTEISLLHVLLAHDNEIVDSTTLIERVWRGAAEGNPNSLRVHMHRLRRKLGWNKRNQKYLIKTVRGIGYTLSTQV